MIKFYDAVFVAEIKVVIEISRCIFTRTTMYVRRLSSCSLEFCDPCTYKWLLNSLLVPSEGYLEIA